MCSIEYGLRQKGHFIFYILYFSNSFFVVIILCTTLKVDCISLLSFEAVSLFRPCRQIKRSTERYYKKQALPIVSQLISFERLNEVFS